MEDMPDSEPDNLKNSEPTEDLLIPFDPERADDERFKARLKMLCQKYEYAESLIEALEKIAPVMAEYYGDSELVLQALENCPIHLGEPREYPNDYLSQYFPGSDMDFHGIPSAAFIKMPIINNGKVESKELVYLKNFSRTESLDPSDPARMDTLVHELGHLIGSAKKGLVVEPNGDVRVDIGYSSEYYRQNENGQFVQVGDSNGGIEEMVVTFDTNEIMRKVLGDDSFRSREYPVVQRINMPADKLQELKIGRLVSSQPAVSGIDAEKMSQLCQNLDRIIGTFTMSFSEMQPRGGGKALAKENTELAVKVEEILNLGSGIEESEQKSNAGEPWTDSFEADGTTEELEPDIGGVPQTVWRGERLYLDNIDQLGSREISTLGHEAKQNQDGKTFLARDKKYASAYAIGTDGVKFYDGILPKEQIPIGVVYKINNRGNHLGLAPTDDRPDDWGPFAGKFREFTTAEVISPDDYLVEEIYIMDDFVQPSGHRRSDFRRPLEVFKVGSRTQLPEVIERVKKRISELDDIRSRQPAK